MTPPNIPPGVPETAFEPITPEEVVEVGRLVRSLL